MVTTNYTILNNNNVQSDLGTIFCDLSSAQNIDGKKTFSTSPVVPTPITSDNSTSMASTAFVKAAISYALTDSIADAIKAAISSFRKNGTPGCYLVNKDFGCIPVFSSIHNLSEDRYGFNDVVDYVIVMPGFAVKLFSIADQVGPIKPAEIFKLSNFNGANPLLRSLGDGSRDLVSSLQLFYGTLADEMSQDSYPIENSDVNFA
jgi:hypothetical protein